MPKLLAGLVVTALAASVATNVVLLTDRPTVTRMVQAPPLPPETVTVTSIVTKTVADPEDAATIQGLRQQVESLDAQLAGNNAIADQLRQLRNQEAAQNFDIGCPMGRAGCNKNP